MTPAQCIALWQNNPLSERPGAQGHFDDLCELLAVDKPRDPDNYCFERGAGKASGGGGWTDVCGQATPPCMAPQVTVANIAAAYGLSDYTPAMPDEEILRRLLALNLARKAATAV